MDGLIHHTYMFGFLAVKYHRSFPNSKVIVKGCIPMHTQCAYGTCWPAFEHLATWILWRLSCSCNCQSFLKFMTTGLLSLGGTVWRCLALSIENVPQEFLPVYAWKWTFKPLDGTMLAFVRAGHILGAPC